MLSLYSSLVMYKIGTEVGAKDFKTGLTSILGGMINVFVDSLFDGCFRLTRDQVNIRGKRPNAVGLFCLAVSWLKLTTGQSVVPLRRNLISTQLY